MPEELGVAELKRRFSELLSRVELKGERIAIRRRGRAIAALVPVAEIPLDNGNGHGPRRGLLAAAGVWEDCHDIDALLSSMRQRDLKPKGGPES